MLEPLQFNVEFEIWPQHITLVPWFPCDDATRLDDTMKAIVARHKKFSVQVEGPEQWGKKHKYEVVTIKDPQNLLHGLHQDVFDSLEGGGFPIHQKDFLGDKYRPHIDVRNQVQRAQGTPETGAQISISQISLISQVRLKKSGRMIKKLKQNYELQD